MILNLMVGVGIKCALSYNDSLKTKYRLLLAGSTAASLMLSYGLHCLHKFPSGFVCAPIVRFIIRVAASCGIFGLGWIPKDSLPAWAFVFLSSMVALCIVLVEFFGSQLKLSPTCTTGKGQCSDVTPDFESEAHQTLPNDNEQVTSESDETTDLVLGSSAEPSDKQGNSIELIDTSEQM